MSEKEGSRKTRGSKNGEIGGCRAEIRVAGTLKTDSWKEKLGGKDMTSVLQRAGAHFEDTVLESTLAGVVEMLWCTSTVLRPMPHSLSIQSCSAETTHEKRPALHQWDS